jgi:two-component system sensor histidine kinase PilS (NtrC family)
MLRLVVTTLLLGATVFFQLSESATLFVKSLIPIYMLIGATFLLSFLYAVCLPIIPNLWVFSFVQVVVDVVYYTVLVHFTGGASSVFSLIYIFPIIASGLLHFRRGALTTAAISCVLFGLLINAEFHGLISRSEWRWVVGWVEQGRGYVLWVTVVNFTVFFLTAFLSSSVAEQLQRTRVSLDLKETDFRQLSELHSSIVRSIPSGIATTDDRDLITFVNAAGVAVLGSSFADLTGTPLSDVFPAILDGVDNRNPRRQTYRTAKEIRGEQRQFELTVSDLRDNEGEPRGRLLIFHEVTLLKKMEERVRVSEHQTALVRIAARMAHEIRNPLAALRGAAELLAQVPAAQETERKLLNIVVRESDRLNSLLADFLVTVNPGPREKVRFMLDELVEETTALFSIEQRVRRRATVETLINKGVEVEGDPTRIRQALWNLLVNAADAIEDRGTIRVVLDTNETPREAILKVQDTGIGIPAEVRDRIFEPFTTSKEGGTGLGLSIVHGIVEAHKGAVEVEKAPVQGTVFVIRLPLAFADVGEQERRRKHG